ncbi:MAG: hypothetical protein NZT92_22005, partial [Abditibacteriales bacterium]|nr:hypothetical protein [Abditibacteriales bacterium]
AAAGGVSGLGLSQGDGSSIGALVGGAVERGGWIGADLTASRRSQPSLSIPLACKNSQTLVPLPWGRGKKMSATV